MDAEVDFYGVLGIQGGGTETTQLEVRKAYRGLALLWHPDKQAGKSAADVAAAAVEFEKIQKAHEVLLDEEARKAYDELRSVRKRRLERESQYSAKKQKMRQDLRDREQAFEVERAEKREEEQAATRLKAEITRIRAKRRAGGNPCDVSQAGKPVKSSTARTAATPAQAAEMKTTLTNTLKVSWACTDGGAGGYTATGLRKGFEEFGAVEDVVIRESKSGKKGSALVVMSTSEAASAAVALPCGVFSNPLVVAPVAPAQSTRPEPAVTARAEPAKTDGLFHVVASGYRSHENEILDKMRKAGGAQPNYQGDAGSGCEGFVKVVCYEANLLQDEMWRFGPSSSENGKAARQHRE